MPPYNQGEHSSVAHAFYECSLELDNLDRIISDDYARFRKCDGFR